ncbi:MAG: ABC transporter substrate-binding protein [Pseudomonadota bacterium]
MRCACLALVAGLLSSATYAQTKIEFWHAFSGNNGNAVDELAAMFNDSQSDYEIQPIYTGNYTEGTQKLTAAIAGRTAPGLVMLEITRYGLFADRGALEPLQPYIDAAGSDWTDQIRPFALEASKYLGESYVIPFNVSTPVMYYNKDLFRAAGLDPEQPPKTWDEVTEVAKVLTIKEGDQVKQWGVSPPPQWVRWAMTNQAAGGWVDPTDNAVQLDMKESIFAYQYAADWVNVHGVASQEGALDSGVANQWFDSGRTAIEFNSTGGLTGNLELPFDLGVAPLPCQAVCAAPIGGATLGIVATADQEVKDGAWEFIRYVTTPENSGFVFVRTGYLPIIKGAIETDLAQERIAEHPEYLVANTQLEIAFARARPPAMPAIRSEEPSVWEAIVLQQQTAEEALTDFAATMRDMIAQN